MAVGSLIPLPAEARVPGLSPPWNSKSHREPATRRPALRCCGSWERWLPPADLSLGPPPQVRLQVQSLEKPQYRGTIHCFQSIIKQESVSGWGPGSGGRGAGREPTSRRLPGRTTGWERRVGPTGEIGHVEMVLIKFRLAVLRTWGGLGLRPPAARLPGGGGSGEWAGLPEPRAQQEAGA